MDVYDHCRSLVRERDRERYLSVLFAPSALRPHLYAIYAYDLELAHVADAVREPMAGEIRLQWWREAIAGLRDEEAAANPVAAALLDTIKKGGLRGDELASVADARQFELLGDPMPSMVKLFGYLDSVYQPIMRAAAALLNGAAIATPAILHAARAYGFTLLIRRIGWDSSRGRVFVPLDLLAEHEVHTASLLAGENSAGLRAALQALRKIARAELAEVQEAKVPADILPAILPLAIAPICLARMDKRGYDPFRTDITNSPLRTQFELWRAARSGKI